MHVKFADAIARQYLRIKNKKGTPEAADYVIKALGDTIPDEDVKLVKQRIEFWRNKPFA